MILVLAVAALYRLNVAPLDVVPPGCFSDEAHYGLDALAVLDGHHAVFFPDNGGREPLFIYLVAGSVALFGRTVAALRLPAALAGTATVGLAFLAVREMFRRPLGREAALAVATLAGFFLAVSQWHVTFSRIAFRASTTPLLETLAFWLFWRGLNAHAENRRATPWFVLSGAALGACLYTYLASRFVPLVLVGFVAGWLVLRWARQGHTPPIPWRNLALLVLVALVVFAPLGAYFALHPDDFLHRAGEASVFNPAWNRGDPLGAFVDSAAKAVGILFWAGDPNWRHNIAGQPILNPILAFLFLAGLALALWRVRRLPYLFALAWLAVMTLPSALTAEGIPNSLRNLTGSPVVYVFPALALVEALRMLKARSMMHDAGHETRGAKIVHRASCIMYLALLIALSIWNAALTYHNYFFTWANHPETARAMNADMGAIEVTEYMNDRADQDTAFLLLNTYEHPAVAFLHTGASPYASLPDGGDVPATIRTLCQEHSRLVAIRWDGLDQQAMTAENFALDMLEGHATRAGEESGEGFSALFYKLPLDVGFPIRLRGRDARFGEAVQLTGYLFRTPGLGPDTAISGRDAWVALRWRLSGKAGRLSGNSGDAPPLKTTLRLLDPDGHTVVQLDRAITGPESVHQEAQPGDTISDYTRLSIPSDLPPGAYTLVVGVYPPNTMQLLPVTANAQTDVLLTLSLITVMTR